MSEPRTAAEQVPAHGPRLAGYTIERSDEDSPSGKVLRASADRTEVEIPVPVGSLEAGAVNATVATGVGAYHVALVPTEPVAGLYAGQAQVSVFGQTGLPMASQLVTRPDNVPLDDADQAWLLLPRATDSLFAPVEAFEAAPDFVVAPLEHDDFVERWVATTEYEYRLGDSSVLTAESGQVLRSLRFGIEPLEGGIVTGRFSDRWKGLYDARSAEGVLDFVDVVFEGELGLERVGDALGSDELPDPLEMDLPAPAPLPAPPVSLCTSESFFPADPVTMGEAEYGCGTLTSRSNFKAATAADQAACALAAAYTAQQGNTTSRAIAAFLDEDVEDPGGQSFAACYPSAHHRLPGRDPRGIPGPAARRLQDRQ